MARKLSPQYRPAASGAVLTRAAVRTAPLRPSSNRRLSTLFRQAKSDEPCEKCRGSLHRQAEGHEEPAVAPPIVHEVLSSPGQPLEGGLRTEMEHRFGGADFSNVRIHTGDKAAQSAAAVNARAYTVGQDVVMGEEPYASRFLAHELVHVDSASNEPGSLHRAIHPAIAIPAGLLGAALYCVKSFAEEALNRFSSKSDKFRHCWVSCKVRQKCGYFITQIAGLGKELSDRIKALICGDNQTSELCSGAHGDWLDSLQDLSANQQCLGVASSDKCSSCCESKFGDGASK